jgi:3-hydroxybutyryl-CoA dehydrogenase
VLDARLDAARTSEGRALIVRGEPGVTPNTQALESARYLDERFIQMGHLGIASGEGFYRYPDPAFEQPGFI